MTDLRYGMRMLAGSPGFTFVALISLSLGLAIATSAYSELNGFVLRDVPSVSKPGELVALQAPISYPDYLEYRERKDLFAASLAYVAPVPFIVRSNARTERVWGHLVTASYFSTLGVQPLLGRLADPRVQSVVVSYRFWQDELGGDRSAIGKSIGVNGHAFTVIGIGPKQFQGAWPIAFPADLWIPVTSAEHVAPELADNVLNRRDAAKFYMVGRLQPGVTAEHAEAVLNAVAHRSELVYGDPDRREKGRKITLGQGGKLMHIRKQDLSFFTTFFLVLGGTVLLIACSNLANMMLARTAGRRREIALRLCVGASPGRLIRQLLTESMLLAAAAGIVGFVLATLLMSLASRNRFPYPMPVTYDLRPDVHVFCFALLLTIFTGIAFGLAPAWKATRADLTPALKGSELVPFGAFRRLSLRNSLLLCQIAGSIMLLVITGYLALAMQRTMNTKLGFDPKNLYVLSLDPVRQGYSVQQTATFFDTLLNRVENTPGIVSAALTDTLPAGINGNRRVDLLFPDSSGSRDSKGVHSAVEYLVGNGYFETTGIPIVAGRGFERADQSNRSTAVIVSEKLLHTLSSEGNLIGRRIEIRSGQARAFALFDFSSSFDYRTGNSGDGPQVFEIVGVAKDVSGGLAMVEKEAPPVIYFCLHTEDYSRPALQGMTLMTRTIPGVDGIEVTRHAISAIDDRLLAFDGHSMPELVEQTMFPVRVGASTYGLLGIFGLILASVGLAGVTAYSVAQRGREIGIRMALGAKPRNVLGLVLKESLILLAGGTCVGLVLAWMAMRLLSGFLSIISRLSGMSSTDPVLVIGVPLLLGSLGLIACYLPARKATRFDPVRMLRQE
jgi:predicted permease